MKTTYDVIVIGGGPAGSTIASILAREGRSVVLFEKERFPRHHIGESLMTDTYFTFQRMGLLEKLKASPFVRKYSVQFANPAGRESRPFYFFEANHHECAVTWQVTRAQFDLMLIEHAAEQGAQVYQETQIKRVLFDGERAYGVEARLTDGSLQEFHAPVVVDATGQTAMLSNKLGWRVRDPKLKKAVLYSYFKGAHREPDLNGGATLVFRTSQGSNGWFWYIPLENDITSVGVVANPEYLVQGRGSKSCAGDGFILIGDAYGFLDPIYSSGVLLALKMAELAADSIHQAFRSNDFSGASLGHYQAKLDQGIESMRKLVYAFYNEGFSFAQFLQKYPEQRVNIISLLMGDVFKEGVDNIYGPMADFAVIPPPLYEQLDGSPAQLKEPAEVGEVLSAKYQYYDDAVLQEAGE